MGRRDSDKLTLYLTMFSCIWPPYSRLDTKSSFPMPDLPFSRTGFLSVAVTRIWKMILDQNSLISKPYPRLNCSTAAHTYIPYIVEYPPPGHLNNEYSSSSFLEFRLLLELGTYCGRPEEPGILISTFLLQTHARQLGRLALTRFLLFCES